MAFILSAAIGGAARRGSELIQEERENAIKLIDDNLKTFGTLGTKKLSDRRKVRKNMAEVGEFLKSKGFSDDQIASAWHQNSYQEVADHIKKLELSKVDYKPAEIISFAPDYESSGLTFDQHLDGVLGKVQSGMSVSDAVADMGGTGLQGMFMRQRAEAAASASGMNIAELRALATDDLEYGTSPGGVIKLEDPVAAAQAEQAMSGGEAGQPGVEATASTLFNFGADLVGGKSNVTAGGILYDFEQPERRIALNTKIAEMIAARDQSRFSGSDRQEMMVELRQWAEDSGYYTPKKEGEVSTGAFADDPQTVEADTIKNISGMKDADQIQKAIDTAYNEILRQLEGDPEANKKASEARDRMIKATRENSGSKKGSDYHREKYPELYDSEGYRIEQE
jgi:hypothetical protein